MIIGIFSYEIKENQSLILNTDGKYYIRNSEEAFNGIGIFENGFSYYFGEFKNGMKDGYGESIVLGERYIGNFKGGLFEGKGVLKKQNGEILEGIWKRNEFIKNEKNNQKMDTKIKKQGKKENEKRS